jgi:hypothetical protein
MQFKAWLIKNEDFREPPVERPDQNAMRDAEEGRPGAFPTYGQYPPTPGKRQMMKKKLKKR